MLRLPVTLVASLVLPFCASASIIPELQSGPVSLGGGNFLYVYQATVSDLERLDPTATAGVTCASPSSPVTLTQCNTKSTFLINYHVHGVSTATTIEPLLPAGGGVRLKS